jgi:hypothetical protein
MDSKHIRQIYTSPIAVNRSCDGKRNKRQRVLYVLLEIYILLEHAYIYIYIHSHVAKCDIWELLKSMFDISRKLHKEYQLPIRRYLAL